VTKFDWEKPKPAPEPRENRRAAVMRRTAMADYVVEHDLACFKCGTRQAEWAKIGRSGRGPWAICVNCVRG
jgi:hypothetical protein